jgi:hypothetical protein
MRLQDASRSQRASAIRFVASLLGPPAGDVAPPEPAPSPESAFAGALGPSGNGMPPVVAVGRSLPVSVARMPEASVRAVMSLVRPPLSTNPALSTVCVVVAVLSGRGDPLSTVARELVVSVLAHAATIPNETNSAVDSLKSGMLPAVHRMCRSERGRKRQTESDLRAHSRLRS